MWNTFRITLLVLVKLIFPEIPQAQAQSNYALTKQDNKVLSGNSLANFTQTTMKNCLPRCLENCLCMSFDICDENKCQLRTSNAQLKPSSLEALEDCSHYEFKQEGDQRCDRSCMSAVNCCLFSNPCENGGTCTPERHFSTRFKCACPPGFSGKYCSQYLVGCPDGYTGDLCDQQITSCRGYRDGQRISGRYKIFDHQNILYEVYCHFTLNSTKTWTLIQSYSKKNYKQLKISFTQNEDNYQNLTWDLYRLPKAKMESIWNDSTHWQITCGFSVEQKVDRRDFLLVSLRQADILEMNETGCKRVEYINVRGYECRNCTVWLSQRNGQNPMCFKSYDALQNSHCEFQVPDAKYCNEKKGGENNFGFYKCKNKNHRCVAEETSTTETWLGG